MMTKFGEYRAPIEVEGCVEEKSLTAWFAYVLNVLNAYQQIVDSGCCNDCAKSGHCDHQPAWGELVRYNCYDYVSGEAG